VVAVVAAASVLAPHEAAFGWANGTDGCSSFGAHDWILKRAIRAAGNEASWVRTRVALRATDDPDCKDGIDHASGSGGTSTTAGAMSTVAPTRPPRCGFVAPSAASRQGASGRPAGHLGS
jgi:hypothetical protein